MKTRFDKIKVVICLTSLVIGSIFLSGNSKISDSGKPKKMLEEKSETTSLSSSNIIKVNSTGPIICGEGLIKTNHILSLDGSWRIVADSVDSGLKKEWWKSASYPMQLAKPILVPGNTYEALPGYNGIAWYLHVFELDAVPLSGRRSFLCFGAVQYRCRVWLNGHEVGSHEGGESPFELEVTGKLITGSNPLILRVENPLGIFRSGALPIFYDQGGIISHVYLKEQPTLRIADVYAKPDPATGAIKVEVTCDNAGAPSNVVIYSTVSERASRTEKDHSKIIVQAPTGMSVHHLALKVVPHLWDLDDPFLYSVEVRAAANGDEDLHRIERLGFRDFRIVDGFFHLNGRRIFLKCTHSNHYDPVLIQGVSRDMTWLGVDIPQLKAAGFNTFRSLAAAMMPEQLAIADDIGFLMYSEHGGSWLLNDSTKFTLELKDILQRDRHSPSLVMFGLLNEIDKRSPGVYSVARKSLPLIRTIDDSRLIMLSSGRWDRDFKTGSASNPGSVTWDVMLGGEGPKPMPTGNLPDLVRQVGIFDGGYSDGGGDLHVYHMHPASWDFLNGMRTLASSTHQVFLSEGGCGSTNDYYTDQRKLIEAKVSPESEALTRTTQKIKELEAIWSRYGLSEAYKEIPEMITASQQEEADARDLLTRAIRSNPKISGYSLTSLIDAGGAEGIWNSFREWKTGHKEVVTNGWAPTRFCLLVNPVPIAAGKPFRLIATFVDEDHLPSGSRHVILRVRDSAGTERWTKTCTLKLGESGKRPFATLVLDEELPVLSLSEGHITVEASVDGTGELPGSRLEVPVYSAKVHPRIKGTLQVIGLNTGTRDLLVACGANIREHDAASEADNLAIVCGPELPTKWNAKDWRGIYAQVARGAHLLVLGPTVLHGKTGPNHYLPVVQHGKLECGPDWLYHCEVIAKPGPVFEGLPSKLLTGEIYGHLLQDLLEITGATPPDIPIAISFNGSGQDWAYQPAGSSEPHTMQRMNGFGEGLVIATWKLGAGKITVCTLDLISQLGTPVSDRLIVNLVRYIQENTAKTQQLPDNFEAELDKLGIVD
jgi:hypothetical protein